MKIGIVGLGLIGGSLALDLRSQGHRILGSSRRSFTCQQAIDRGIVDDASPDLSIMTAAEVIFLCTPIADIQPTVEDLISHLRPSTILTDVGSVKVAIVEEVAPLWRNFVGGHPMAGKAESGLNVAEAGLFRDKAYVLTPLDSTPPMVVETVAGLAQSLQATLYRCTPAEHDRAVAWISHLPVMASASLISACLSEENAHVRDLAQNLASSGFRDTSRVGGGNPELGMMMARYNQTELLRSLHAYRHQLDQMIAQIEQADWQALNNRLKATQQARPLFLNDHLFLSDQPR